MIVSFCADDGRIFEVHGSSATIDEGGWFYVDGYLVAASGGDGTVYVDDAVATIVRITIEEEA